MKTYQLICIGLVLHTIFFYSIFDIYFTSPVVHGMTPHVSTRSPPAKRLVLFSADGLRADKMFELDENGKTRTPYLRNIIENIGAWGVSHTRLPTESRPGHVALIAGLYEDVSAVAKGWKENPVEFDSVFNQSRNTWSWGSPDILPMFAKGASGDHVMYKCYPSSFEDFSTSGEPLDTWVFDEVKSFFDESMSDPDLKTKLHQDKIVFFLHLLGIDTNGHSKKPFSSEYLDNIKLVDRGIKNVVTLIEDYYGNDNKTSYILTSDHGMTDWGSHGAGHSSETLTPLVVWGAGLRQPIKHTSMDTLSVEWKLDHLKRTDIEQADIAPLMAALIGVNFPMNSVGVLPHDFLGLPDSVIADMMYANTRQILEQYQVKLEMKKSTTLSIMFRPFSELTPSKMEGALRHIRNLIQSGNFHAAINECKRLMEIGLEGMNYYQTYDRLFLGGSIFCGYTGWMMYILTLILEEHSGIVRRRVKLDYKNQTVSDNTIISIFGCIGIVVVVLLFVQSLPWTNYLYCLIPLMLWLTVCLRFDILKQAYGYMLAMKNIRELIIASVSTLLGLEILVVGFFLREMFSVGLVLMAILPWISSKDNQSKKETIMWSLSCLLMSIFPLLPVVVGKRDLVCVRVGGVAVILVTLYHHITRSRNQRDRTTTDDVLFIFQIFCSIISTIFSGYIVHDGMLLWQHGISWCILVCSFIVPLMSRSTISCRLNSIFISFSSPFILLSISYEIIFFVVLGILLYTWLLTECSQQCVQSKPLKNKQNLLENTDFNTRNQKGISSSSQKYLVISDIQRAFYFIFIILTAFFGTGNIASINSFDPSSVLCFVSVFKPFIMGALLLFKIVIPFLLVTCVLQAIRVVCQVPVQGLFMIILLMSDCMALNFFFLVQDYGSWLDIGSSISHYVIVMCMIIFIMLLYVLSNILTSFQINLKLFNKRSD